MGSSLASSLACLLVLHFNFNNEKIFSFISEVLRVSRKWQVWKLECTNNKIFIAHHAFLLCVVFCFNYRDAVKKKRLRILLSFSHAHASVHVMCHLLSETFFFLLSFGKFFFILFYLFRSSRSLAVTLCLQLILFFLFCEWGKFSSNYRFIASFPSQHFDCLQIFTFIHNILDVCRRRLFSQHQQQQQQHHQYRFFLFFLKHHHHHHYNHHHHHQTHRPLALCLHTSHTKSIAKWIEDMLDEGEDDDDNNNNDANKVLKAFDRTAPCPVDSSQLYRLSWSNICCLLIFFLRFSSSSSSCLVFASFIFFSKPKYNTLYVWRQDRVERWNYYCFILSARIFLAITSQHPSEDDESFFFGCSKKFLWHPRWLRWKHVVSWRNVPLTSWRRS